MPYQIHRETLIADNFPYEVRDETRESHYGLVHDEDMDSMLRVELGSVGMVYIKPEKLDDDGDLIVKVEDLILAIAKLKQIRGDAPDVLNPYLDEEGKEEAARVIAEAAGALRTHPVQVAADRAATLESQGMKLIDLASSRDYAATAVVIPDFAAIVKRWEDMRSEAERHTDEQRQAQGYADPLFYDGMVEAAREIQKAMGAASDSPQIAG